MIDSIYAGPSGMETFAESLKTISNNVANMNTVGYKGRQTRFVDLFYQAQIAGQNLAYESLYSNGSGVASGGSFINDKQGEIRSSGNDLDVAIDGHGYLVLQDDNREVYTRAGQFEADNDGYLVGKGTDKRVLFLGLGNHLRPVTLNDYLGNPAKATAKVSFTDSLSTNDATFNVTTSVYDSLGGKHDLQLKFTNNTSVTAGSWLVGVSENGGTLLNGEIRFDGGGRPVTGFDSISLIYQPSPSAAASVVGFDFTKASAFSSAGSNIKVLSQDGYSTGALIKTAFDNEGHLVFTYSNAQKVIGPRLALASFGFDADLEELGESFFANTSGQERTLGGATDGAFGKITGGSIEASNVDLSAEFSELIITQRGYQASSQVMTAANEMLQQLFQMKGQR